MRPAYWLGGEAGQTRVETAFATEIRTPLAGVRGLLRRAAGPLGALLALGVFVADWRLPASYAASIGYLLPLLVGLWVPGRRYVVAVAAASIALSSVARLLAPGGGASSLSWVALGPAWIAIAVTAGGLVLFKAEQGAADDERKRNRAILETAVDGMVTIDEHGSIQLFNRAAERMFGWRADEVIGKNVKLLMPAPYWAEHDGYLERYRTTSERRVIGVGREVLGQRKDASIFPLDLALAEVPLADGRVFTAILRDITERKEHERAREQLLRELGDKNAELERFAYTVSHDLKSPLVTIKGFLGLIRRSATEGDHARLERDVTRIATAADRMQQLLDDLLELSRAGQLIGATSAVSLNALAAEVVEVLAAPLSARGAVVEIAEEMPAVRGDLVKLRQVLQNLLENALKFMGPQKEPRIQIDARPDGDMIDCSVTDNGVGVEPRYEQKIFGLFEKLDRESPGTGVGLALVKRIVEVHGGRVRVESEGAGRGSRFHFTLPPAERTTGGPR